MNYYEHHLGDYLRDTAHLSMVEDGAYRRLLDVYYVKEQPLPAEPRDVYRLVRANTKPERDAVLVVLREFFSQAPDGWRHKRCDEEIEKFKLTQEDSEDRKENEKERQRRHRAERKEMFAALRARGIVPPWDSSTTTLRGLVGAQAVTSPVTVTGPGAVTPPVTRTATATQTPSPTTQPPETERVGRATSRGTRLDPDWKLPDDWREWARAERPDLDPDRTAERFRDYWTAVSGQKATRSSWVATWRNWVRNERSENRPHLQGQYARNASPEPDWRREQRERMQQAAPYATRQPRKHFQPDEEATDVLPLSNPAA